MPEESQDPTEREQLIDAREQIKRQLELIEHPLRTMDRNSQLVARLRAMLADIEDCLGDDGKSDV